MDVLSPRFRGLFLQKLLTAHREGRLQFFGEHARLAERKAFAAYLGPSRKVHWRVYCKPPFGGPEAVLAYLARYTHRVAISNHRLLASDHRGVTFRYKDYRAEGPARHKIMTLAAHEFIRRFVMHVLPKGFHRIRHYGLFASGVRADNLARARELLAAPSGATKSETDPPSEPDEADRPLELPKPCPCCGGRMLIIETFAAGCEPKHRAAPVIRIDTS